MLLKSDHMNYVDLNIHYFFPYLSRCTMSYNLWDYFIWLLV